MSVKSICKTIEISIFNVHTQQLSGPCKNRDFRETGQQGSCSAGDAIRVYGASLFLVFPMALNFQGLLRFSPLLKNPANQISVRYTCDMVGEEQCYRRVCHKAVYLVMCLLTINTSIFCFLSPGLHGPDKFLNGRLFFASSG